MYRYTSCISAFLKRKTTISISSLLPLTCSLKCTCTGKNLLPGSKSWPPTKLKITELFPLKVYLYTLILLNSESWKFPMFQIWEHKAGYWKGRTANVNETYDNAVADPHDLFTMPFCLHTIQGIIIRHCWLVIFIHYT